MVIIFWTNSLVKVLKLTLTHVNNVNNVNNVERRVFFYNFKGKFFYCEENVHWKWDHMHQTAQNICGNQVIQMCLRNFNLLLDLN